jgi:hypothetical protein
MRPVDIARVCHEANRAVQIAFLDPLPSDHWDDAESWQRESAIEGVLKALDGEGPEKLHESWCDFKRADGWVFGEVKSFQAKTHPCLVPYADLPYDQKIKDHVFAAIVTALS